MCRRSRVGQAKCQARFGNVLAVVSCKCDDFARLWDRGKESGQFERYLSFDWVGFGSAYAETSNSASLTRQERPLPRISLTERGGFGAGQAEGISIIKSPVNMPQEVELSFEYVISFIYVKSEALNPILLR